MTAGRWLDGAQLEAPVVAAVRNALQDVGVHESPRGSNRGKQIDQYNKDSGSPLGSVWCATALASWLRRAGCWVPATSAGSCDKWVKDAKVAGRWIARPKGAPIPKDIPIGAAVLYGSHTPFDASHCGLIVISGGGYLVSCEGNTTTESAAYSESRNGLVVSLKDITAADPVLGFVLPKVLAPKPSRV